MKGVQPHEFFRLDFDQILEEGKRQEENHPANKGEYDIVKGMHEYFACEILPRIVQDDYVFEAATRFATDHAVECFRYLRLGGQEVYRTQQRLDETNDKVYDFLARAYIAEFAPSARNADLPKASDFIEFVDIDRLDENTRAQALALHREVRDHEDLQLTVTLRGIRDSYETNVSRIMFVVRRAMKVALGLPQKKSDGRLLSPPDYIDWYVAHADSNHPFYRVLCEGRKFYKVARNVGSHHIGLKWKPKSDIVVLQDRDNTLPIHVHKFQQGFRYLVHFCDLGVRGILAAFCERERGPISNMLVEEYRKTFPSDWTGGEEGIVVPYLV